MARPVPLYLALGASLCLPQWALAFPVYHVGGDAACDFSDIQTAINAAAAANGSDEYSMFIAQNRTYSNQHIVITGQHVNLLGGVADCSENPGTGQTVISGTSGHSVFEIRGDSQVYMGGLEITGGSLDSSHSGGGIYFSGSGSLTLAESWVFNNRAGYGGGIDVSPSGPTTLNLMTGTVVSANTALVSGGGIRIEGETTLNSTSGPGHAGIYIAQNAALGQGSTGYGGGVEVLGPAVANISSVVDLNSAPYGGGIAAIATDNGDVTINLFTTDPAAPVMLYGNTASHTGGGIYLKPSASLSDGYFSVELCANDYAMQANVAANGAAIYGDTAFVTGVGVGTSSYVYLNTCSRPAGAVRCAAGTLCNQIIDNVSADSGGHPTNGAAVLIQSGGRVIADRLAARRNRGGSLFQLLADAIYGEVQLHNCLLADNVETGDLLHASGGARWTYLRLDSCTLANNQLGSSAAIFAQTNFAELTNSIVYQPGQQAIDFRGPSGDLTAHYVLANDTSTLAGGIGIIAGTPSFVDAAHEDYHLVRDSPGVDYAPASGRAHDLDLNPRAIDLADVPNLFGPMDLGAYELQDGGVASCVIADTIFCTGFDGL